MAKVGLESNRKFKRLVRELGLPRPYCLGLLETMWRTAYQSTDPVLGSAADVEVAAEWPGMDGVFATAAETSGFIHTENGVFVIHDFWEHAPDYVTKRYKRMLERKQAAAKDHTNSYIIEGGGQRPPMADNGCLPRPDLTRPDLTRPEKEREESSAVADPSPSPADLADTWNETAELTSLPVCRELNAERRKHAIARLREKPDIAYWREVISRIGRSPFCTGSNDRGWRADFDFLIRRSTHLRVLEGKYDAHASAARNSKTAGNADALRRFIAKGKEVLM